MLINSTQSQQIKSIWDTYIIENKPVLDTKGNPLPDIDANRRSAIADIKQLIGQFLHGTYNLYEFKTALDSYNKRNNFWGFTATKGQMFFNQLTKNNEGQIDNLTVLLQELIQVPVDLEEALGKIERLEEFTTRQYRTAKDKRKVANPGSVGYFLSYFWQIHAPEKWPIMYTSLIRSFVELGIWQDGSTQREDYERFYALNEDIKWILSHHAKREISNWDAEHAFWNFNGNPHAAAKPTILEQPNPQIIQQEEVSLQASFELSDYLLPRIAKLVEVGGQTATGAAVKGSQYEKLVAEIFRLLEFDVTVLGQGSGRNPDAVLKFREENTAFIVDAKAYSNGYSLGIDDRAIKEYIHHYCPSLQKDGYKKIGFIIVSNSFRSSFDSFINDITWNTDVKRFILLSSEALLYLFAYKIKDQLPLNLIIEKLIGCGNVVTATDIIREFDDV